MSSVSIRRALISVSDKSHLATLVPMLQQHNIEVVSSGGTAKALEALGLTVTPIQEVTGNPEAFGGRMKTLSFQVSSALLYRRGHEGDEAQASELGIEPIDLVICNLYPFAKVAAQGAEWGTLIENIDIGGPTMIRAAAKNCASVCCVVDPSDYESLVAEVGTDGTVSQEFRTQVALKAFQHTAQYDSMIATTLCAQAAEAVAPSIHVDTSNPRVLRYGENPHQRAWVCASGTEGLAAVQPIQGKALSYNNMLDADAAYRSMMDIAQVNPEMHAVTVIKHLNPCGASLAHTQMDALIGAWSGDPVSAFGSIIAFNQTVTIDTARFFKGKFIEVVIAPDFTEEALWFFSKKKNVRVLKLPLRDLSAQPVVRSIDGGFLIQDEDCGLDTEYRCVHQGELNPETELLRFGSMVTKHLKSNAISLVQGDSRGVRLLGAGMGNPNRLVSTEQAIAKANDNVIESEYMDQDVSFSILISDAFFPFRDNVDLANDYGIKAIGQPGGSIRDEEVIEACKEHGITMYFTGRRHFRH